MKLRIEEIITKWIKCEIIGDEAMAQIDKILHVDEMNKKALENKDIFGNTIL